MLATFRDLPSVRWPGQIHCLRFAVCLTIIVAWGIAHRESLDWLVRTLSHDEHVVQRYILISLAGMATVRLTLLAGRPLAHPRALTIAWVGVVLATIVRATTEIHFLQAAAALCLLYALSSLLLGAERWRRQWPVLAILLICLPIQPHLDAFLGLPLRLWTAGVVAPLLQMIGVASVTVESIIVTESSVADVASVCSGVRTLWYALALWLGARLLWPQTARHRWWLAGVLTTLVAITFNALRVFLLVLALHEHAAPLLVSLAHASVGLLALAVVGWLNTRLCYTDPVIEPATQGYKTPALWQYGAISILLLASAAIPSAAPAIAEAKPPRHLVWPAPFRLQPLALSENERDLVLSHGSRVAEKHRFDWHDVRGSLLVVESSNWRAQHAPELCLIAQGARISKVTRIPTHAGVFRIVQLDGGRQTVVTWFQSDADIVPDLAARLWAQAVHRNREWAMVTLVVDGDVTVPQLIGLQSAVGSVIAHASVNSAAAVIKEPS